jgi:alkylated DNA repair dioxygenase AlkB
MAEGIHVGDAPVERLALDDHSWVDVARGWLVGADELFEHLRDSVPWQTNRLFRYDHEVEERRLGASWRRGSPLPHPVLAEATRWLQNRYRAYFDGFSLIQYRDGRDGQGFHRDTDMRYLDDTIIAVLSLGAQRPWLLRPHSNKHSMAPMQGATHDLAPASGDLIVMGGRAQADWQHSVPYLVNRAVAGSDRTATTVPPRISLQWRFTRKTGQPYIGSSYSAPRYYGQRESRAR